MFSPVDRGLISRSVEASPDRRRRSSTAGGRPASGARGTRSSSVQSSRPAVGRRPAAARPSADDGRRPADLDASVLREKVRELERARVEEERLRLEQESGRRREITAAKRHLASEVQLAGRQVRRTEMEVGKVARLLSRVEQQLEQAETKKAKQLRSLDDEGTKARQRHAELEAALQERMAELGQSRARLANSELASKLVEMGVVMDSISASRDGPPVSQPWQPTGGNVMHQQSLISFTQQQRRQQHHRQQQGCQQGQLGHQLSYGSGEEESLRQMNAQLLRENRELRARLARLEAETGRHSSPPPAARAARLSTPASATAASAAGPRVVRYIPAAAATGGYPAPGRSVQLAPGAATPGSVHRLVSSQGSIKTAEPVYVTPAAPAPWAEPTTLRSAVYMDPAHTIFTPPKALSFASQQRVAPPMIKTP